MAGDSWSIILIWKYKNQLYVTHARKNHVKTLFFFLDLLEHKKNTFEDLYRRRFLKKHASDPWPTEKILW